MSLFDRTARSLAIVLGACSFAAVVAATPDVAAAPLVGGLGGPAGYGSNLLYYNDDGSSCEVDPFGGGGTGPIDVSAAFPNGLTFFGANFRSLCLNTNGNISFGDGVSTYTPEPFPVANQRMIAPWWGDVDTRNGGAPAANGVYWDVRRGQFTATWHNVDYFDQQNDMRNDFQLILRTFDGCGIGDFDVEFRYNHCEWVTGDASGGMNGHGGTPAQAGFDAGDRVHFYALPGSLSESVANLCTTSNIGEPGVWRFRIRGGELPCTGSGQTCNTGQMGACADGITTCHAGTATCDGLAAPSAERCDGVDNDCNGMTDEGDMLCPAGTVCERGSCVPQCVEGGCFENQTCTARGACVDNTCLSMTCPTGQRCLDGACVDACQGLHCPPPSVCRQGGCVVPCDGVVCDTGQVCENGRCQVGCSCRVCLDGYACSDDGTCQPSDCLGMNCSPGEVCQSALTQEPGASARCVDPCFGAVCPQSQHCEAGRCIEGEAPDAGPSGGDASSNGDGSAMRRDGSGDGGFVNPNAGCACSVPARGTSRDVGYLFAMAAGAMIIAARRRRE